MKEYMILFKGRGELEYSREELQKRVEAFREWVEGTLGERYVTSNRLEREGALIDRDRQILTDGPFLETKELIAGYVLILAEDFGKASELARACPLLDFFDILLRPVVSNAA